jgi:hypothetical protein
MNCRLNRIRLMAYQNSARKGGVFVMTSGTPAQAVSGVTSDSQLLVPHTQAVSGATPKS